jgi:hypothetical protein
MSVEVVDDDVEREVGVARVSNEGGDIGCVELELPDFCNGLVPQDVQSGRNIYGRPRVGVEYPHDVATAQNAWRQLKQALDSSDARFPSCPGEFRGFASDRCKAGSMEEALASKFCFDDFRYWSDDAVDMLVSLLFDNVNVLTVHLYCGVL